MKYKFCQDTIAAKGVCEGTGQGGVSGKDTTELRAIAGPLRFQTTVLAKPKPEPINLHVVQFGLPNHKNQTSFGRGCPQPVYHSIAAPGTVRNAA